MSLVAINDDILAKAGSDARVLMGGVPASEVLPDQPEPIAEAEGTTPSRGMWVGAGALAFMLVGVGVADLWPHILSRLPDFSWGIVAAAAPDIQAVQPFVEPVRAPVPPQQPQPDVAVDVLPEVESDPVVPAGAEQTPDAGAEAKTKATKPVDEAPKPRAAPTSPSKVKTPSKVKKQAQPERVAERPAAVAAKDTSKDSRPPLSATPSSDRAAHLNKPLAIIQGDLEAIRNSGQVNGESVAAIIGDMAITQTTRYVVISPSGQN